MNIPMVDLKGQYEVLKQEIDDAVLEALSATQFILGPNVLAFEQEAADYLGVEHAVGCASGTDALHLALAAAGIGEGDEVITTPFTFIATAEAISYVGATPVFVDIDPKCTTRGMFFIQTNSLPVRYQPTIPDHASDFGERAAQPTAGAALIIFGP